MQIKIFSTKRSREEQISYDNQRLQEIYSDNKRVYTDVYMEHINLINYYRVKYSSYPRLSFDDAYQEALIAVYQNIKNEKLRLLSVTLRDYISKIMNYKIQDELTKIGPEVEIESPPVPIDEGYNNDQDIRDEIVNKVVKSTNEPCKTILQLFYFEKMSYNEMLGKVDNFTSINSLRTQSYRCKKGLEERLRKELRRAELI